MTSDARFGIELYEQSDTRGIVEPLETQTVAGEPVTIVGHVWSADAERIVTTADGRVLIIDPSGRNPTPLNSSLAAIDDFLEAFRVFYLGERPPVAAPLTKAEARERLAALQRGETLAPPAAPAAATAPREQRVATLRSALEARDTPALASGSWWARILLRPEFDSA